MKKIICIVIAITLMIGSMGCSNKESFADGSNSSSNSSSSQAHSSNAQKPFIKVVDTGNIPEDFTTNLLNFIVAGDLGGINSISKKPYDLLISEDMQELARINNYDKYTSLELSTESIIDWEPDKYLTCTVKDTKEGKYELKYYAEYIDGELKLNECIDIGIVDRINPTLLPSTSVKLNGTERVKEFKTVDAIFGEKWGVIDNTHITSVNSSVTAQPAILHFFSPYSIEFYGGKASIVHTNTTPMPELDGHSLFLYTGSAPHTKIMDIINTNLEPQHAVKELYNPHLKVWDSETNEYVDALKIEYGIVNTSEGRKPYISYGGSNTGYNDTSEHVYYTIIVDSPNNWSLIPNKEFATLEKVNLYELTEELNG